MIKATKKTLAVFVALVILLSCMSVAAMASCNGNCEYCPTIVIPGVFQSDVHYYDENGNLMLNSQGEEYSDPFFMESTNDIVKLALKEAILPIGSLLLTQQDKDNRCADAIAKVLGQTLMGNLELDNTGTIIKNIQATKYNTSLANLSAEDRTYALNQIPLNDYVKVAGLDHLYFYSYVSTGNLKTCALEVYDLIQTAKRETGHSKVNIVPISQGGSVFNALMQVYKDKGEKLEDDVNRVCFIVPASNGTVILGDIYRYGLLDDVEALYGYMFPSLMDEEQQWLAYLVNLILRIMPNADLNNILDEAAYRLVEDYMEYSTCMWGLLPNDDYLACREIYLMDEEDAVIREQTDWYYNAQKNHRNYILEAKNNGVEFFDVVDYNYTMYQICDSWNKVNSDGIIQTDSESFGTTSVAVDTPLSADYTQQNTYCTNPAHNHIDSGRLIDVSTGILCESTFCFLGQDHEKTARNDVIIRLATRVITDDSFTDVYSDPAFPQFNYARDSRGLINTYNEWKNYDTSALSAEDAAEFSEAITLAGQAVNSTVMPTAEFNAARIRLENIIYRIQNGEDKAEESQSFFITALTKVFKWLSELLLKVLGGKGWSDVLFFRNVA